MTSTIQPASNPINVAQSATAASSSASGTTSPLAAVPAQPTARSTYANATKKQIQSPAIASSTPPVAVGGSAPQHGKANSISPVNGKNVVPPAVPAVGATAIASSSSSMVNGAPVHGDHSRKPSSVTISAAGASGYMPNGNPVGPNKQLNISFGSIDAGGPPALANSVPNNSQSNLSTPLRDPRITSPAASPSPIPQPPASGGRPPSGLQGQGNGLSFGSIGGDQNDNNMRIPQGPATPSTQPQHLRRESSQSAHSDMSAAGMANLNRGFIPNGGRGRGYGGPNFGPQMAPSPVPSFRQPMNPRGAPNMAPQFSGQGPMAPHPNSPYRNPRSPAITPAVMAQQAQFANGPQMGHGGYGYPQHLQPQQGPYGMPPQFDPTYGFYPGGFMHPTMPFQGAPPSPRLFNQTPHGAQPHYMQGQYGNLPNPQSMSRTPSQASERPSSTLPPAQTPSAPPAASHVSQTPSQTSAPVPSSTNFTIPTRAKSKAIEIKAPDGKVLTFDKPATSSAVPAAQPRAPVVVSSTPTPPPRTGSANEPQHVRSESQQHKTDSEVKQDFREQVKRQMEAAQAEEKRKKEEVEQKAVQVKADTEAREAKAKEDAEAKEVKVREEAEAKAREEAEAKAREEAEAKAREEAEARAREEAEARAREEAEARAREEAEAKAVKEREEAEKARVEAERVQAEAEKAKRDEEEEQRLKEEEEKQRLEKEEEERRKKEEDDEQERLIAEMEALEREEEERERAYQEKKKREKEEQARREAEEKTNSDEAMRRAEREAEEREEARARQQPEEEESAEAKAERELLFASLKKPTVGPGANVPSESGASTPASDVSMQPPTQQPLSKQSAATKPKPAALKLETNKAVEPAQPTAGMQALKSARFLEIQNAAVNYPQGIASPNPALNQGSKSKGMHYDKSFLLQFQDVFKEKPSLDWDNKVKETVGDSSDSARLQSARAPSSMGGRQPSRPSNPVGTMGNFVPTGRTLPPNTTSQGRFMASTQGGARAPMTNPFVNIANRGPGGFPVGAPPLMNRTASSQSIAPGTGLSSRTNTSSRGKGSRRGAGQANAHDESLRAKNMPLTAGQELKPLETSKSAWKPTVGQQAAQPLPSGHLSPELVQRKVKAALNKMTPEKFDKIANDILDIARQSKDETDGRTLRQIIQLTFEKACDEAHWASMYAKFCKRMLETMDSDIKDENVVDKNGKPVTGGALFRKYLLNRCQEEFERGWEVNLPDKPEGQTEEAVMLSDEYYIAAAAKRRGLGLIQFIGELYKLGMLTVRIMHECVMKLLNFEGVPDESAIESLVKLLRTVGATMDSNEQGHGMIGAYFERIEKIMNMPGLPSRMHFMLLDTVDLKRSGWQSKDSQKGPKTIQEIHAEAQAAQQQAELERARQSTRGTGGRMPMGRGDARAFSGNMMPPPDYPRNQVGMDDLRRLNKNASGRNVSQGPATLGPSSMFGSRSSSGRKGFPSALSRGGEESGASSRTGTPPVKEKEKESNTNMNAFSALEDLDASGEGLEDVASTDISSPQLSKTKPADVGSRPKSPSGNEEEAQKADGATEAGES